jgi:hypothetical protein
MNYTITHKPMEYHNVIDITFENVDKLYIGKGNVCRCGCKGEYYTADEDPSKIKNTLEKMSNGTYPVTSIDNYIFEIEINKNIVHTIYLKK